MAKKKKAAKPRKRAVKKGPQYVCDSCGLVVTVDEPCGCTDCDLICCGAPMRKK